VSGVIGTGHLAHSSLRHLVSGLRTALFLTDQATKVVWAGSCLESGSATRAQLCPATDYATRTGWVEFSPGSGFAVRAESTPRFSALDLPVRAEFTPSNHSRHQGSLGGVLPESRVIGSG
jgi:hypothetical protein